MTDVKLLRVFVASPNDVQPERDALADVVKGVNATLAGLEPVQLRLVSWQEDVEPAVGGDPQAIVNSQIGTNYDVFIGILWKHFGTRTPRAESGTQEEFQRAVELQRERPSSVSVMFYFKTAPVPVEVDTKQLGRVQKFRKEYSDSGLYGTFENTSDFASKLQIRLSRLALKWSREGSAPDPATAVPPETPAETARGATDDAEEEETPDPPDEDAGFLDLVEEGTASFEEVTTLSGRITNHIERLGSDTKRATSDLESARDGGGTLPLADVKRVSNRVASSMDRFATQLEAELPPFRLAYDRGIRAYGRAATLLGSSPI